MAFELMISLQFLCLSFVDSNGKNRCSSNSTFSCLACNLPYVLLRVQISLFYVSGGIEYLVKGLSCAVHINMVLDNVITSPHRRTQAQNGFSPPILKRQYSRVEELGSCSTLVQRHRFLLTALILLTFLCTVYLYFAVTLGAADCSGLTGARKASCHLQQAKASVAKGKLKFL
ncbi:uncharacterized protein [Primulina eburnea]|uniref:uncharacterized protein isoform X1 n=2 Tax=Primulina eburnea TaxID=1245227 RepID=UPI003C6C1875